MKPVGKVPHAAGTTGDPRPDGLSALPAPSCPGLPHLPPLWFPQTNSRIAAEQKAKIKREDQQKLKRRTEGSERPPAPRVLLHGSGRDRQRRDGSFGHPAWYQPRVRSTHPGDTVPARGDGGRRSRLPGAAAVTPPARPEPEGSCKTRFTQGRGKTWKKQLFCCFFCSRVLKMNSALPLARMRGQTPLSEHLGTADGSSGSAAAE